jgi:hypothetical protein
MSKAELLAQVADEWASDRLVCEALHYEHPALIVAIAEGVICAELVRRCLISEAAARRIAAALVRKASLVLLARKFNGAHCG